MVKMFRICFQPLIRPVGLLGNDRSEAGVAGQELGDAMPAMADHERLHRELGDRGQQDAALRVVLVVEVEPTSTRRQVADRCTGRRQIPSLDQHTSHEVALTANRFVDEGVGRPDPAAHVSSLLRMSPRPAACRHRASSKHRSRTSPPANSSALGSRDTFGLQPRELVHTTAAQCLGPAPPTRGRGKSICFSAARPNWQSGRVTIDVQFGSPLPPIEIIGDRFRLRPFRPDDLPVVEEASRDDLIPSMATVPASGHRSTGWRSSTDRTPG